MPRVSKSLVRNIITLRDFAKRFLALLGPLDCFLTLMLSEFRFAAEFYATTFRIGPAECRTFLYAPALRLGRYVKHGEYKLGKVRGDVYDRLGDRAKASSRLLQVASDHE